ncbi:MAG: WG repeat-containing protein [Schaedlerella sp.]|nr:WG repeat-containing protein [Schaedlerella sp.]
MKYCRKCGKPVEEGAKFCGSCGTLVEIVSAEQGINGNDISSKKRKDNKIVLIIGAVLIVAAIIIAGILIVKQKKETKEYNNYISKAENYMEELDYKQAKDFYLKAIEIDEKQREPYVKLAVIYVRQQEYEKAEDILKQADEAKAKETEETREEEKEIRKIFEEAEGLLAYEWVVDPSIEAEAIYYLQYSPSIEASTNETYRQEYRDYAVIKRDGLLGLIDMEGNLLTDIEYESIENYFETCILTLADPVYVESFDQEWSMFVYSDGQVTPAGGFGGPGQGTFYYCNRLLNTAEDLDLWDIVVPKEAFPVLEAKTDYPKNYENIEAWNSGLSEKYAVYLKDRLLTEFVYDYCGSSHEGLLAVCQDGKWGYIDQQGNIVIPLEYDASWTQFSMWSDKEGALVTPGFCYSASNNYVNLCKDGKWELRDTKGNLVIPAGVFEEILPVYKGKCWVKQEGKWGVIRLVKDVKAETAEFEYKFEGGKEFAIITGFDENHEAIWKYETGKYEAAQLERVSEIGTREDLYYFVEDGTVKAIQIEDGSIAWENSEFDGSGTGFVFGEDGVLYICGYLGPDFFAVDKNGKTLCRIDMLDSDYYWPYEMEYKNRQVIITFEEGSAKGYIDVDDFSYYFPEGEGSDVQDDVQSEIPSGPSKNYTLEELCAVIADHYNTIYNVDTYVCFEGEAMATDEGYFLTLRDQSGNVANKLVTGLSVNLSTGAVEDDWGEVWYLD